MKIKIRKCDGEWYELDEADIDIFKEFCRIYNIDITELEGEKNE